jgi:hypothetical protein
MKKPQKKSAGASRKADSGNVILDLGEKHSQKIEKMIDQKFAAAGMAGGSQKTGLGRPGSSRFGGRFLGRPSMGAGYRPWFSRFGGEGRRPWMGQGAIALTPRGGYQIIPMEIRNVVTSQLLTGMGLGIVGNRALVRLTPSLWPTNNSRIVHEGLAFAAGLIPLLFKRNATTLGVALPGAVYLGGTLVDMLFNALNMPQPALAGSQPGRLSGMDAALAARQKLAAIQSRISSPVAHPQGARPRVLAQAQ